MNLDKVNSELIGNWSGNNLLRLSWQTPSDFHSTTNLAVSAVTKGRFLTFSYTWNHEDVPHEGLILLGYDAEQKLATASWVDSWHMNTRIMACEGSIDGKGIIDLRGSYAAPPGPDWGWRITIAPAGGKELQIVMHNVSPDGEEDLAVQADYNRVS